MAQDVPITLGPWPRGIVNVVNPRAVPEDGLVDAVDFDIDRDGYATARSTYSLLSDSDSFDHLFHYAGTTYAVSQGAVGVVGESAFTTIYPVIGEVGWCVLGSSPVFCDYTGVYRVEGLSVARLTLRDAEDDEDRYGLTDMPGGHAVAAWMGRIWVLRGRSLLWSEALDYGSHSPARNFVRLPSPATWMAPVTGGIFVGLREQVIFLGGTHPKDFTMRTVAGASSPYSGTTMSGEYLPDSAGAGGDVAIWFSDTGFVIGTPDGSVQYPQATNIRGIPLLSRRLSFSNERVYAFPLRE